MQRLIVFNHPSWVDSILLQYLFAPSGVSREANLRYPIVGRIIFAFQNIYVPFRRANGASDSAGQPLVQRSTTQMIADRCAPAWCASHARISFCRLFRGVFHAAPVRHARPPHCAAGPCSRTIRAGCPTHGGL